MDSARGSSPTPYLPIDPALREVDYQRQAQSSTISHESEEWEYEYDENETETFYLTVDLSSKSTIPLPSNAGAATQRESGPRQPPDEESSNASDHQSSDEADTEPTSSRYLGRPIQILNLHTGNPLISYQNQLYTCEWSTSVGTELLFASPTVAKDLPTLRSTPHYSILAASSHRLTCTPAQLVRRQTKDQPREADPDPMEWVEDPIPPEKRIPVGNHATLARHEQARFLERLMRVKGKKGEKDEVTAFVRKSMAGPVPRKQKKVRGEERRGSRDHQGQEDQEAARVPERLGMSETVGRGISPDGQRKRRYSRRQRGSR
ncbi:MAG: hypothetical protein M1833_005809 [Piccolia ochrophora]|nr:MAG: hypothetical protein M1833_005809 [Piccolia ochrophora]